MPTAPTDILMAEHRIIERVTAAMSRFADALSSGGDVERRSLAGLCPFMRQFADGYHHGKEEHRLFPALIAGGLPKQNGPVQVMCLEHDTGRGLVARLASAVEAYDGEASAETRGDLADALRDLAEFYGRHIWKEDNILFPMAAQVLDADSAADVLAAFREVTMPEAQLQELLAYVESL